MASFLLGATTVTARIALDVGSAVGVVKNITETHGRRELRLVAPDPWQALDGRRTEWLWMDDTGHGLGGRLDGFIEWSTMTVQVDIWVPPSPRCLPVL